jgi:hypothetical protein
MRTARETVHYDPVARTLAAGALLAAVAAMLFAMTGLGQAKSTGATHAQAARKAAKARKATAHAASIKAGGKRFQIVSKPKKGALLTLGAGGKFTAKAIPTVAEAKVALNSRKLGGKSAAALTDGCPTGTTSVGTWCIDVELYSVPVADTGKNNYSYATQACEKAGGYLPSAGQLIGAAPFLALASRLDDNSGSATTQEPSQDGNPPDTGLKDEREMSSTLFTTTAGDDAAGSEGVSDLATGNPQTGQPNPTPEPADPDPATLDYVTVYDNGNQGGFAGGEWVGDAENFRCAYGKVQGAGPYGDQ